MFLSRKRLDRHTFDTKAVCLRLGIYNTSSIVLMHSGKTYSVMQTIRHVILDFSPSMQQV